MAYTAKIIDIEKQPAGVRVLVEIKKGSEVITREYVANGISASPEWLRGQINDSIKLIEALNSFQSTLEVGPFDLKETKPPVDAERQLFASNYQKLRKMRKAVSEGILPANNPEYVALNEEIKNSYKGEYINIIEG